MKYDLAIIGAGSAAFSAAIRARQRQLSVVMIERADVGGTCVNVGCIPSKALLTAAAARAAARDRRFPGIETSAGTVRMTPLMDWKDTVVGGLRREKYVDLAREHGWEIIRGDAQFGAGPVVTINGITMEAAHYLIATGSVPVVPDIAGLTSVPYLTSTSAMELRELPESMVVVGGNSIGLELGQLFARLGTRVTIVEARERIAPYEEPEVSGLLAEILGGEGIDVRAGVTVRTAGECGRNVALTLNGRGEPETLVASRILIAAGRRPNTSGLNLGAAGVETGPGGAVLVNAHLQTANGRIWAAGDVTGHPQFVYVAGTQGTVVVDNAFGRAGRTMNYRALPRVTFTTPHIASVGLTEAEAQRAGLDCESRSIALELVPRARVNGDTRGVVKIVAERYTGILRGVHMLAPEAGEALLAAVYAMESGMTVGDMANTWCPYLTISEGIKLAAQAFSTDVSRLSCCGG